jgi:glucosylglycerate synthase
MPVISSAEDSFLADDFLRQLMSVGEVDLLVGIPSHNDATTIGRAVETIEQSFQQSFPRDRVVILNVDGGSRDSTSEVFLSATLSKNSNPRGLTSLRTIHRVTTRYSDDPSQGGAFRTMLAAADLLRAKACAVISPVASNLTPECVSALLKPVARENFDYVAPLYRRHKFDGLLARHLLYPMSRAIFGKRIRELHSDEFAFSCRLGSHWLNQNGWQDETVQFSPETWMAIGAISSDFRCCQTFLGQKTHPATSSGTEIVEAVRRNVAALFWCIESQQLVWMERTGSEPVPTIGSDHDLTSEPLRVNRKRMLEMFRSGVSGLTTILETILESGTHAEIQRIAALDDRRVTFAAEVWVKTLYEFAAAYHHSVLNRDHLIQALVPLYRGRIYSFLLEHQASSPEEIEADTESLCLEFEHQKPNLLEKWKARE